MNNETVERFSTFENQGVQKTDHWIVCSGVNVLTHLIADKEEALEKAKAFVYHEGLPNVSVQHVGD